VEFPRFRGILHSSVLAGDNGTNTEHFGRVQAAIENYLLPVDMIAL